MLGYWKPSQLPRANVVIHLGGESPTDNFTRQIGSLAIFQIFVLIPTDKYSPYPYQENLFVTDGDCYRKSQPIKMQSYGAQTQ